VPSYFLDTSAFAKLYHQEAGSEFIERIAAVPGAAIVSRLSLIEIESVFAIKVRTGQLEAVGRNGPGGDSRPTSRKGGSVLARQAKSVTISMPVNC
jgi:hypothetical protein